MDDAPGTWDDAEWGRRLEALRPRLCAMCQGWLRNQDEATDVAQQVIAQAWARRETFRGDSTLLWWLVPIARNVVRNRITRRRPEISLYDAQGGSLVEERPNPVSAHEATENQIAARQLRKAIAEAARAAKPPWDVLDWLIFETYFGPEKLSWPEVAVLVDDAVEKIKYRYYRRILPVLERVGDKLKWDEGPR